MSEPFIKPDPAVRKGRDLPAEVSIKVIRRGEDGDLEGRPWVYIASTVRDYKTGEDGYVLLLDGKCLSGIVSLEGPEGVYQEPRYDTLKPTFLPDSEDALAAAHIALQERSHHAPGPTGAGRPARLDIEDDRDGSVGDAFEAFTASLGTPMKAQGKVYTVQEAVAEAAEHGELPPGSEVWCQPPVQPPEHTNGAQFTTAHYGDLSDLHSVPGGFAAQITETVRNRGSDYGTPDENHQLTADFWTSYFSRKWAMDVTFSAEDVCVMNILQKMSRNAFRSKDDNFLDAAGYAENVAMLRREQRK